MISKDLLAHKFYWESTKHCYRGRAGTNRKFLPLKAKALHVLSNPIKAPSQKLPGLSSPQPSANKQTWHVTHYSGWGYLTTSTAWPFWSNQTETGLKKKKKITSPPTKIQQHGEPSELKLVLSETQWQHGEDCLLHGEISAALIQRYHIFPSSLRCNYSSTSFHHSPAALYCFSRKIKWKPRGWLLHLYLSGTLTRMKSRGLSLKNK